MDQSPAAPHVFILAGMHRSGTSVAASILQAGGVNIGTRLMGADHGNPRGHFENMDFFEFHRDVLESQSLAPAGWVHSQDSLASSGLPATFLARAHELIAQSAARSGPAGWGWKDPRSTLFLKGWQKLLPGGHFIFIYRAPWEVADSIYRRGTDQDLFFRENPANAVRVWCHYNQLVLDFLQCFPGQSLLVSNGAVVADPAGFIGVVNERFGSALAPPPPEIVSREILHTAVSASTRPQLVLRAFPEVATLLGELHARCTMQAPGLSPDALSACGASQALDDSFRDWFEHFQIAREKDQLCAQVASLESRVRELDQIRWEWLKSQMALATQAAELEAYRRHDAAVERGKWRVFKRRQVVIRREQAIEVRPETEEATRVAPERTALILPGPFYPGSYELTLEFADAPDSPPASVSIHLSKFLELQESVPITIPIRINGLNAKYCVNIPETVSLCSLILPSAYPAANILQLRMIGPS